MLVYDGAGPFDLAVAKAHGAIVITGYLVGHPGGYDPINKARVDAIRAAGMGFLPNWERVADYLVTCGKAGGLAAGQEALDAMRALGIPDNGTVACAFSWDVSIATDRYALCGEVADGIIQGLGGHYLFSAYAQGGLLGYFRSTGRMKPKGWLSASSSWPGFNPKSPNIAMVQSHDADGNWLATQVPGTDVNTVIDPYALGAWWPAGSPYLGDDDDVSAAEVIAALKAGGVLKDVGTLRDVTITPQYQHLHDMIAASHAQQMTAIATAGDPSKLAAALLPPIVAAISKDDQPVTQDMLTAAFVDALKQLAAPAGPSQ